MNYDFYIFDCDGVILNSNQIKTEAFSKALEGEPEDSIAELIEFHKENGGLSRYEKFRYYFSSINPIAEEYENNIDKALNNFKNIVFKDLISCDYIPGVISYLESIKEKGALIFVNSGGDEEELKLVFKKRGIDCLFTSIKGSPSSKKSNNESIMNSIGVNMKGVFFGDSKLDYEVAKQFGLDFILISGYSEWRNPKGKFKKQFTNFFELLEDEDFTNG
tara:strand:- start:1694 stop:2350 length:657 start_codon:yes stop_codon:yes gene_type:complete